MIKVEIFSAPGCTRCASARRRLLALATEFSGIEIVEINVLEQLDYAVALGLLATPAIAIDGRLCFTGLPSVKTLRAHFTELLDADRRG